MLTGARCNVSVTHRGSLAAFLRPTHLVTSGISGTDISVFS